MQTKQAKRTVLLVDDDKSSHLIHKYMLTKHGYEMVSAYTGRDGLQAAIACNPNLILLDYMMPELDGRAFLREIRQNPAYSALQRIPIVMLTAATHTPEVRNRLFEYGLDAYLEKPFGERELLNVIESVLLKHRDSLSKEVMLEKLQQSREFFEEILSSFPGAILTTDLNGKVNFFRTGAMAAALDVEMVTSGTVYDVCQIEAADHEQILAALQNGERVTSREGVLRCGRRGQMKVPVEVTFSLLRDHQDEISGILVLARDLISQKRYEQERREKDRVVTLAAAMATVNHEINNPLTPIIGNAQLLMAESANLPDQIRKRLQIISDNAHRIAACVQKLSSMSRPLLKEYYKGTMIFDLEKRES